MADNFIKWVQERLTVHGFTPGAIDGIDGPNTRLAIMAFEKYHALPTDGIADERFVRALRVEPVVNPREAVEIPDRDVVEKEGTKSVKNNWPRQKDVEKFFGKVGENQVLVEFPYDMYLSWDPSLRTKKFSVHKKVAASAERVLNKVAGIYSPSERRSLGLDQWGGSLNVRKMRGGSQMSMHSWGIALDFDPLRNQLSWHKPKARLSHDDAIPFWKEWEKEGWVSLGRAQDFDYMHVQAANL